MGKSKRSKNKKKSINFLKKNYKQSKQMEKRFLIGVYDSYRTNGKYNKIINVSNSKFIGSYSTEPIYTMFDLGMDDGVIIDNGNCSIKIEVWEISETTLNLIKSNYSYYDELSDDHNVYLEKKILSPFGEIQIFFYNESCEGFEKVVSGDWIEYLIEKRIKSSNSGLLKQSTNFVKEGINKILNNG